MDSAGRDYPRYIVISMESDTWITSSFCADKSCVKVKRTDAGVLVKSDRPFPLSFSSDRRFPILFTDEEWTAFVRGVKEGEFDL